MSIDASFKIIEAWLKKNAPRVLDLLGKPATPAEIAEVEAKLKVQLPEDFNALYRRHNGGEESDLMPTFRSSDMAFSLLPLKGVISDTRLKKSWAKKGWIAFGYDGSGDYYVLDLSKSAGKARGRVLHIQHEDEYLIVSPSLATMFEEIASGLMNGAMRFDEQNGIVRKESIPPTPLKEPPKLSGNLLVVVNFWHPEQTLATHRSKTRTGMAIKEHFKGRYDAIVFGTQVDTPPEKPSPRFWGVTLLTKDRAMIDAVKEWVLRCPDLQFKRSNDSLYDKAELKWALGGEKAVMPIEKGACEVFRHFCDVVVSEK